jgi:hypothetical protein
MKKIKKYFDKFKEATIKNLQSLGGDRYDADKPYLFTGRTTYSLNQVIEKVREDTDEGIEILCMLMSLTADRLYREKDSSIHIYLTVKQEKKFKQWQNTFKDKEIIDVAGSHFGIKVIFSGIGPVITGFNWKGDEIDLTDYSTW